MGECKKRSCKYYGVQTRTCDYCYLTGTIRGGTVEDCTKYIKGDNRQWKSKPIYRTRKAVWIPGDDRRYETALVNFDVLSDMMSEGLTVNQIADSLGVSANAIAYLRKRYVRFKDKKEANDEPQNNP